MLQPIDIVDTVNESIRPRSLWRNRDYLLLWSGQAISSVGTQVSGLALPFLILAITHSAEQTGYAFALRLLPYLVFSLPAGALIDRWNRKLVMIICDSGRALALGSIIVALMLGHLTILQIYSISFIDGTFFVFFNIAEVACLPRVVTKAQLSTAMGYNEATDGVALLAGPPFGGILFGLSHMLPFVADAISYVISVLSLFVIKVKFQDERRVEKSHIIRDIREGLAWLWHAPLIRYMAFLTGSINFAFGGYVLIIILLTQHMLPISQQRSLPIYTGLIFTIGSVGSIIGSVIGAQIQRRFSFGQVILSVLWIQAILWPLQIVAPNPYILGALSAGLYLISPVYNVVSVGYRLTLIPDELLGRVNSAFRMIAFGSKPLGATLTGILLQKEGIANTVIILSVVLLLIAVLTNLIPTVRKAQPVHKIL